MTSTPIIEAIGPDRVTHILQCMLRMRALLNPSDQRVLDESVADFIARNPLALATVLLDRTLPIAHPSALEVILRRAHELSPKSAGRYPIEKHA